MNLRIASLLLAAMAFCTAPANAQEQIKGVPPVTLVYLARGAPNACGAGCDRWIAVEGAIDKAAAGRLRRVLQSPQAARLPIYLHSPGGAARESIAMGRLLRVRKATARVARTVVKECGTDQASTNCIKLKQAGKELEAELTPTRAICNSACTYVLIGAATREVPVGVSIGIHSARVTLVSKGSRPVPQPIRDRFLSRARESLNRDLAAHVVAMGIDRGLFDLSRTIPFESMHALTRDELFRFGVDRRELVETDWTFSMTGSRPGITKIVEMRNAEDPTAFRVVALRIACASRARVILAYGSNKKEPVASVAVKFGNDQKLVMVAGVASVAFDWTVLDKLKSEAGFSLTETAEVADAAGVAGPARETTLSNAGLPRSIETLARSCP